MPSTHRQQPLVQPAEVVREYGPFPGITRVHGVSFDGTHAWIATGEKLLAFSPESGEPTRELSVQSDAGTAFDGTHLYQIAGKEILKLEPASGRIVTRLPAPAEGRDSGLAWAEGSLWVGEYRAQKVHQIDPHTGAIRKTLESDRFVTGVTWLDGELWHGAADEREQCELRRIDPESGAVLARLQMPEGAFVSGVESNGRDTFFCGGGSSGRVRAVKRPGR